MGKAQMTASEILRLLNGRFSPACEIEFWDHNDPDPRGPLRIRTAVTHGALKEEIEAYRRELDRAYDCVPDPEWRDRLAARKSLVEQELQALESYPLSDTEDQFSHRRRIDVCVTELALITKTQAEWGWTDSASFTAEKTPTPPNRSADPRP